MAKIFICYRRDDCAGYALLLHSHLEQHFGRGAVFMDIDNIPAGTNFIDVLQKALRGCAAVIVMIGRTWLEGSRLYSPGDVVRLEIVQALKKRARVFPVLVNGAAMPAPFNLPEDIRALAGLQATDVRHASFSRDIQKLLKALEKLPGLKVTPAGGAHKPRRKASGATTTAQPPSRAKTSGASAKEAAAAPKPAVTGAKPNVRPGPRKMPENAHGGSGGAAVPADTSPAGGAKKRGSSGKKGGTSTRASTKPGGERAEKAGPPSGTAKPKAGSPTTARTPGTKAGGGAPTTSKPPQAGQGRKKRKPAGRPRGRP